MKEVAALFIVIALSIFLFGGNAVSIGNPFDNTAEKRIEADAAVRVAELERDAAIGVAEVEASTNTMWIAALPLLIGGVVGGAAVLLIIHWQGKIYFERAKSQRRILPHQPEFYSALREVARHEGKQIAIKNGTYFLVSQDGQRQPVAALMAGE